MSKEKSAGSVVYKKENNGYYFLVIKQKHGNHYGFPKGHVEINETEKEAAVREVFEEVGIKTKIASPNYEVSHYDFLKDGKEVEKEVFFFLAEAINQEIKIQEAEIIEAFWLKEDEVLNKLTYENDKDVFNNLIKKMLNKKRQVFEILLIALIALVVVMIPDFLKMNYWLKSIIKILMLFGLPFSYFLLYKKEKIKPIKVDRKTIKISLFSGLLIYFGITLGYFGLKEVIDFSNIGNELLKIGISQKNFIFVFLYIPLVNAFLEEFFFRGFLVINLGKNLKQKQTNIISALLFAAYHIIIIGGWTTPSIIVLAIIGLFLVGFWFNFIANRFKSIIPTYIIHMFANLAINTVALFVLGMI